MRILIGADLVPTKSNIQLFNDGDAKALVGDDLLDLLKSADYRIFNLEVPLTDVESPIDKNGPALIAPTSAIEGYKALSVDCLTVANNHIMDQGADGFKSTVKMLDENGICRVGGGENLAEAAKPFIVDKGGKKIGIYACAEHEFSIAGENTPGANPFDPLESLDHIAALKALCDYVIVLHHGGKEHYRYPSPQLQRVCRKMVEKGADLVVCQHSHCVGCEEKYQNGTIVYGQGNFLFDHSKSEYWQTSLLLQLDDDFNVSYIPLKKQENTVRLADGDEAKKIMDGFWERSEEIKDSGAVAARYSELSDRMLEYYIFSIGSVNSKSFFFRALNKLTGRRFSKWVLKRKFGNKRLLEMKNHIECEAHRELLLSAINRKIN